LVIPLIEKNEWRLADVIKNKALTDGVCDNGIDEKARVVESKVVEIAEGSSVVNNLEEQAIKEILSKFMSTFSRSLYHEDVVRDSDGIQIRFVCVSRRRPKFGEQW
jgi:hypothetical protein